RAALALVPRAQGAARHHLFQRARELVQLVLAHRRRLDRGRLAPVPREHPQRQRARGDLVPLALLAVPAARAAAAGRLAPPVRLARALHRHQCVARAGPRQCADYPPARGSSICRRMLTRSCATTAPRPSTRMDDSPARTVSSALLSASISPFCPASCARSAA